MRYFLTIFLCLFAANVYAAPFVVSDPYAAGTVQPDGFSCRVNTGAVVDSPADVVTPTTKRLKFDVSAVPAGSNTISCKAYKNDAVWGRLESTEVNFTFTRPVSVAPPSGIGLQP